MAKIIRKQKLILKKKQDNDNWFWVMITIVVTIIVSTLFFLGGEKEIKSIDDINTKKQRIASTFKNTFMDSKSLSSIKVSPTVANMIQKAQEAHMQGMKINKSDPGCLFDEKVSA